MIFIDVDGEKAQHMLVKKEKTSKDSAMLAV